jgi:hypothetical protein
MILAIAGPLIIAPAKMRWEALFHKFVGDKHERFKTSAPGGGQFSEG